MSALRVEAARKALRNAEDTFLAGLQESGIVLAVVIDGMTFYKVQIAGSVVTVNRKMAINYFVDGKL
jgi:hypothetical protein